MISGALFCAYNFDRILLAVLSKQYNLELSYANIKKAGDGSILLNKFGIVDKRTDLGLLSDSAKIKYDWRGIFSGKVIIEFVFNDVGFIKKSGKNESSMDSLSNLVFIPFSSNWKYKEISGRIRVSKNMLEVDDLTGVSSEIKLSFKGSIDTSADMLDSEMIIYFAGDLIKKVPEELSKVVLRDERDGWRSLSVKLSGNFSQPSIELRGRLFRLSIEEVTVDPK